MDKTLKIPKINIIYGKLLDPIFLNYCKNHPKWKNWTSPSKNEVLGKIKKYQKEWLKYEKKILLALIKVSGLSFNRDILDVYIVSGSPRQLSNPIIIKSGLLPSEFVDVLTHELIHRLLVLNNIKKKFIIDKKYASEEETAKNHIVVHALLKYIYLDILKDKNRLKKNILRSKHHNTNEYIRAWEIVEKEGYKKLIYEFNFNRDFSQFPGRRRCNSWRGRGFFYP